VDLASILFEINELADDILDASSIVDGVKDAIVGDLQRLIETQACPTWWDVGCQVNELKKVIERLRQWLENIIQGIIDGLVSAAQDAINKVKELYTKLENLLKGSFNPQEIIDDVKAVFTTIRDILNDPSILIKMVGQMLDKFINNDTNGRAHAIGLFLGSKLAEKIIDAVSNATLGFFAIFKTIFTELLSLVKRTGKIFISTVGLVGKRIRVGSRKIEVSIEKIANTIGVSSDGLWSSGNESEILDKISNLKPALVGTPKLKAERYENILKTIDPSIGLGSTGRTQANNLAEQIGMKSVKKGDFDKGEDLLQSMIDTRWPGSQGWKKYSKTIEYTDILGNRVRKQIHYNYNPLTSSVDDFKFKDGN
jgi:hypothetical protein